MSPRRVPEEDKLPDNVRIERALGLKGNFYDFVKMAWPVVEHARPFVDNWHIGAISEHLQAVFEGQIRRLVINIPPGCMKSLTTSVFWPVWCWLRDPGWRFIFASYDSSLVGKRDGTKCIDIVRSKWFQERWPGKVLIKERDPAAGEFYTTTAGMRFATSIGGKVVGRHANAFVVDDPIKPKELTDLKLEECRTWKRETQSTRMLPGGAYVLIMQRLHELDLAGLAEEEGGHEFLVLPMRFESEHKCKTSIGFEDPRTEEEELLWPSYKDEAEVAQQEKDLGGKDSAAVAAQLQQRPAPKNGVIFDKSKFQHYKVLPESFDMIVDSWDCTFKDKEGSDFVAGQRWGVCPTGYYLFPFRVKQRLSFTQTCIEVKAFRDKEDALGNPYPKADGILVEDKANGTAVMNALKLEVDNLVPIEPEGGKVARANAIQPLYEAGNVWHPDKSIAPWIEDHEASLLKFPKGKKDDDVDAETQALNYLRNKASHFNAAMDQLEKAGVETFVQGLMLPTGGDGIT